MNLSIIMPKMSTKNSHSRPELVQSFINDFYKFIQNYNNDPQKMMETQFLNENYDKILDSIYDVMECIAIY